MTKVDLRFYDHFFLGESKVGQYQLTRNSLEFEVTDLEIAEHPDFKPQGEVIVPKGKLIFEQVCKFQEGFRLYKQPRSAELEFDGEKQIKYHSFDCDDETDVFMYEIQSVQFLHKEPYAYIDWKISAKNFRFEVLGLSNDN